MNSENKKFDNKKIIIVGSGFRAMMTAYFCLNFSKDVSIISNNKNIHGVMGPIKWQGGNFDKGYHFFDGFNKNTKKILEDFVGKENLFDFGYGATTYTNRKIYYDHAIPYWPHKSNYFAFEALVKYFTKILNNNKINIRSYRDILNTYPSNIRKVLEEACLRNTNLEAEQLSHLVCGYSHFLCYRQTLLPDFFSNILKKTDFFNKRIASRRKSLKLDRISLYPKGKYIGYIAEIMESRLRKLGLKFIVSNNTKIIKKNEDLLINCDGSLLNADYIFLTTELDSALDLFEEKVTEKKNNHYVSQIFYYFSTNKLFSKYQYVHGNDININTNRATNISLYGEKTSSNEYVLSAEVPTNINSEIWKNSDKFKDVIWKELELMKIIDKNQIYTNYKIFNLEKTLSVPLIDFEDSLKEFKNLINLKYSSKVLLPGIGTFTRNIFIESLKEIFKQ
jgi:hypothetical protein